MTLATWRAKLAARTEARARRKAAAREITVPLLLEVEGTVDAGVDMDGHSERVSVPFLFRTESGPRPDDDDMEEQAAAFALAALQAWADEVRPRYVISASWSAETTRLVDPDDEEFAIDVKPTDSEWWAGSGDLEQADDGYILHPAGSPYAPREHRPGSTATRPRKPGAPGRVWKVTRHSTRTGRGRQRNRGTADEYM